MTRTLKIFHVKLNSQSKTKTLFRFVASTNKTQNPKENKCFPSTAKTTTTRKKSCPEKPIKKKSQFCEIFVHICKNHLNDSLPRK